MEQNITRIIKMPLYQRILSVSIVAVVLTLSACARFSAPIVSPVLNVDPKESPSSLRSYQSRKYDSVTREVIFNAIMVTLQDLDFLTDQADLDIGFITATKVQEENSLKITITITEKADKLFIVRSIILGNFKLSKKKVHRTVITDPKEYQSFYTALNRSLFLKENSTL